MGMFDTIICKHPLPDAGPPDGDGLFQTKDLACHLNIYEITAEGRLTLVRRGEDDTDCCARGREPPRRSELLHLDQQPIPVV